MNIHIGIDEAGRGSWAGSVYATIVILDEAQRSMLHVQGVTDSKKLSVKQRKTLYSCIIEHSLFSCIHALDVDIIDKVGIYQATQLVIQELCRKVPSEYLTEHFCIDGTFPKLILSDPCGNILKHTCVVRGDTNHTAISAASILAKVARDKYMEDILHPKYPEYQFHKHKGYGTKLHRQLLEQHGACPEHRMSFKPVALLSRPLSK